MKIKTHPREYIEPPSDKPLVTRLGTVRFNISSLELVTVWTDRPLPVESGRFNGELRVNKVKGKWKSYVAAYSNFTGITPRREQLLLKAIDRALNALDQKRFLRAEQIRINNIIFQEEIVIEVARKRIEDLLRLESELDL